MAFADEPLLILDGACGTTLQGMDLPDALWQGKEGCNEYLNLSAPETIVRLHEEFLEAGAMVLETNTFGASSLVLAEYGLEQRVAEINRAAVAHARTALQGRNNGYVAGLIGPTTKLPSLGHVSVDELSASLREQMRALLAAGVDALIIETCQDLLQVKTALVACFDLQAELRCDVPVMVSVTIEQQGAMLVGSDIAAVAATLEPFPIFSLGLNCATGPADMASHLRYLSRNWPGRISCVPNQGLPEIVAGQTRYPLQPQAFAGLMKRFVEEQGVSVVGGCCGSTPEHIRALATALDGCRPRPRQVRPMTGDLAGLYQAIELKQEIPPLIIGERANPNGSRKFREFLLADDFDGCLRIGLEQEAQGAQVVDLCAAYAGRNEKADLPQLVRLFAGALKAGLMIDSTDPDCIEASLKLYPGRCIINSINLEDGGANLDRVCRLARRYGAAVVALTIDETGMAMTAAAKVKVAERIYRLAVDRHGLRPQDLWFDPLTFTIGSGDATLCDAAVQTLDAIREIKRQWPAVSTLLGVSNISFGLPPTVRRLINSVFLHEAVAAGLDAAIVDAAKVVPLAQMSAQDRQVCLDLIYDRNRDEEHSPLLHLIEYFSGHEESAEKEQKAGGIQSEEEIRRKLIAGDRDGLEDLLSILLERYPALEIINRLLVPSMREVGELFGRGELLLPFVLQSAEVMKRSVDFLEDYLEKDREAGPRTRILLATVQGDVHDIGKNLVDIILSNNGYKVYNLGIKVSAETIIARARELNVDLIGLSGLLVKSAIVMQQSLPQFQEAGLEMPILLGGAALTPQFVAESCVPNYRAPVVYCADAFAGLKAVRDFEEGRLVSTSFHRNAAVGSRPGPKEEILSSHEIPQVPFVGRKTITDVDPAILFSYLNRQALFRGRWGYRRGKQSKQDYERLVSGTVEPLYARLKQQMLDENLLQPQVVYGYFPCHGEDNRLIVADRTREYVFEFPRQSAAPHLCIADYFRSRAAGGDLVGFFVVTIGARLAEITADLFRNDQYHDYLMMHGLGVELTDALAEYWHRRMREEMGFAEPGADEKVDYVTQGYRGSRYGFGYPACPDLGAHRHLFALLKPEEIAVSLTENLEMVPEMSTSAIVVHHPQAKYFAI